MFGDDPDDNVPDAVPNADIPNLIQPLPNNIFDNNRILNNVGERRGGEFARVRNLGGDLARPGAAGNGAAGQQDDNNSDHNSNGTVFSDIPEEDGFSFANQNEIRFSTWNRFEDTQLYMKFI